MWSVRPQCCCEENLMLNINKLWVRFHINVSNVQCSRSLQVCENCRRSWPIRNISQVKYWTSGGLTSSTIFTHLQRPTTKIIMCTVAKVSWVFDIIFTLCEQWLGQCLEVQDDWAGINVCGCTDCGFDSNNKKGTWEHVEANHVILEEGERMALPEMWEGVQAERKL